MGVLDLIFPKKCLGCGVDGQYICKICVSRMQLLKAVCPYCEKPSIDGFTHVRCQKTYGLDGLTSIWKYDGVIKKAIWALKFKYATDVGNELQNYMIAELKKQILTQNNFFKDTVVVPIPIFWLRKNKRGFNQSEIIGQGVAGEFGYKFIPDLLIKNKQTISQVELSVEGRKQNLKGVFSLNSRFEIPNSIVLFDDVFTTGSTLHEACKTLKRNGVQKVWGITIAR